MFRDGMGKIMMGKNESSSMTSSKMGRMSSKVASMMRTTRMTVGKRLSPSLALPYPRPLHLTYPMPNFLFPLPSVRPFSSSASPASNKLATPERTHTCGQLGADEIGQQFRLIEWVQSFRRMGAFPFFVLRNIHSLTQCVIRGLVSIL